MPLRGFVNIIGGQWRSRRLPVLASIRPTPSRVRETVFNWLAPVISGAHCLDLFAGSGILGFESLSRQAASVVMIDHSAAVVTQLRTALSHFQADNAVIYHATAPNQLTAIFPPPLKQPFDIIFLDPPYGTSLLPACYPILEDNHYLSKTAYIYLEARAIIKDHDLPATWQIIKCKRAGQVVYHLAKRTLL